MEGFELAVVSLEVGEEVGPIVEAIGEVLQERGLEAEAPIQEAIDVKEQGRGGGSVANEEGRNT